MFILLLNYSTIILILLAAIFIWREMYRLAIVTLALIPISTVFVVNYAPREVPDPLPQQTFEPSKLEVQDRNKKPSLSEKERGERFEELFDYKEQISKDPPKSPEK